MEDYTVVMKSIKEQLLDVVDEKLEQSVSGHLRSSGLIRITYEGRSAAQKARNASSKFFIDLQR